MAGDRCIYSVAPRHPRRRTIGALLLTDSRRLRPKNGLEPMDALRRQKKKTKEFKGARSVEGNQSISASRTDVWPFASPAFLRTASQTFPSLSFVPCASQRTATKERR